MDYQTARAQITSRISDWRWRLNNLYWITDKEGREVKFQMNWAQESLFDGMHYMNVILKARQLGFSTFILVFMLDACVFNKNVSAGIIDATLDDARGKLQKIQFAYKRLPKWIRDGNPVEKSNADDIEFKNGSSISVGTSHRGGTLQYLHVSEFGKICVKHPEKAREIVTGALNTIAAGQIAWIESTAEGQDGRFFDICQTAQAKQRMRVKLTPLDFKFHFYPWWKAPEYSIDPDGVAIPDKFARYFEKIAANHGIHLTPGQKAWYVKKAETQFDDMKREYPSTPEEAFEASVEGAILGPWMDAVEDAGRVGAFPAIPGVPVHTFWDIGRKDYTSIWFAQVLIGPRIRVVGFYQNCLNAMPHYAAYCYGTENAQKWFPEHVFKDKLPGVFAQRGWTQGEDFFPHDARVEEWGSGRTRIEQLKAAGFKARIGTEMNLHDGINASRATLGFCEFDESTTGEGRKVLKNYRWEWDDKRGVWKTGTPNHDDNSHGSDGFRTLATSWREIVPAIDRPKPQQDLIYEADRYGRVRANMSVREIVAKLERERKTRLG